MLWNLVMIVLAAVFFLGLLRLHDRLRALERKVEGFEGGAVPRENGDE